MKKVVNFLLRVLSKFSDFKLVSKEEKVSKDMDPRFGQIYELCKKYSMTSLDRMYALFKSVIYVVDNNIPGDFVECGVWRGGSSMLIAETLKLMNQTDRKIYLYDTFEGMPEPSSKDTKIRKSEDPKKIWESEQKNGGWCAVSLEEVQSNLQRTNYPFSNLIFVKGMVEDTIPTTAPDTISLLRLDTDFYDSTYHEFVHLYPRLSHKGILIIDDYGSWKGSRDASDQYFKENNIHLLLHRVDTGTVSIKQ
jgi:O-methyltransferase